MVYIVGLRSKIWKYKLGSLGFPMVTSRDLNIIGIGENCEF